MERATVPDVIGWIAVINPEADPPPDNEAAHAYGPLYLTQEDAQSFVDRVNARRHSRFPEETVDFCYVAEVRSL